eukprot:1510512-Pyramimonas_sp.AAC.1
MHRGRRAKGTRCLIRRAEGGRCLIRRFQAAKIIMTRADLLESSAIEPLLQQLVAHVSALK